MRDEAVEHVAQLVRLLAHAPGDAGLGRDREHSPDVVAVLERRLQRVAVEQGQVDPPARQQVELPLRGQARQARDQQPGVRLLQLPGRVPVARREADRDVAPAQVTRLLDRVVGARDQHLARPVQRDGEADPFPPLGRRRQVGHDDVAAAVGEGGHELLEAVDQDHDRLQADGVGEARRRTDLGVHRGAGPGQVVDVARAAQDEQTQPAVALDRVEIALLDVARVLDHRRGLVGFLLRCRAARRQGSQCGREDAPWPSSHRPCRPLRDPHSSSPGAAAPGRRHR